jgi:tRNA(Ile2) C34 agmatinyltransferase TiaS
MIQVPVIDEVTYMKCMDCGDKVHLYGNNKFRCQCGGKSPTSSGSKPTVLFKISVNEKGGYHFVVAPFSFAEKFIRVC